MELTTTERIAFNGVLATWRERQAAQRAEEAALTAEIEKRLALPPGSIGTKYVIRDFAVVPIEPPKPDPAPPAPEQPHGE